MKKRMEKGTKESSRQRGEDVTPESPVEESEEKITRPRHLHPKQTDAA